MRDALLVSLLFSLCSICSAASERVRDVGYLVQTSNSVYFLRSLTTLESGLPIDDKKALKGDSFCIQEGKTNPPSCPAQEISFVLVQKGRQLVAREIVLEKETEWHRLNRIDKLIRAK